MALPSKETVSAGQPEILETTVYMTVHKGTKSYRKRISMNNPQSAEEQMEDHILDMELKERAWKDWGLLIGGALLIIGWMYLAHTYVLPFLDSMKLF
jgi:hypothetical protein